MMEDLLMEIAKEANTPKCMHIRKACQDAKDLLCLQEGAIRDPSYELRKTCFLPLQLALETKKYKLVSLSLSGFHKILRDDRFHKGVEPEDDSLWLPSQLLCATASLMYHTSENQVHILRVLLAMSLSSRRTLNGRLVLWVISRCGEAVAGGTGMLAYTSGGNGAALGNGRAAAQVVAAAAAAAAQTVRAFCMQLDEECQELLTEGSPLGQNRGTAVGCFSEVIPVIQYLCSRLNETQLSTKSNTSVLFFLECLLALMSTLPEIVNCNTHFTTFLWQKFCPALIAFLGTPRVDKNIKSREHEGNNVDDSGRGSGSLNGTPSFNSQQVKTVYSIAAELVRLVGCVSSLRPVLEALYHRMLLYPPVSHRTEALSSVREMLKDSNKLRHLFVLRPSNGVSDHHSDDMAIIRLIMDAIEECGSYNGTGSVAAQKASVECVYAVIQSLKDLCLNGVCETDSAALIARQVSNRWKRLQDADYQGPLTYQSLARLPAPYRDVVAELQCNKDAKSPDSSDTSGPEDSAASDAEPDSDADSVFLPVRDPHNDSVTLVNTPDKKNSIGSEDFANLIPKSLNLGRCNVIEYNVDLERHNAKQFVGTLKNILVPKLLNLRSCVEVDEAMQDFASKCCQYNATQSQSTMTIMNADGIYLATYSALLLNLKLIRSGHYTSGEKVQIPLTEDQFVEEVHGSGVLVYLSATWLRELYQQILATSLLHAGGYVRSKENGNMALINLLIDMGGLGSNQIMSDWQRLIEVSSSNGNSVEDPAVAAGLRLARRVLTCIWDSMVSVLSEPLLVKMSSKSLRTGERISNLLVQRTHTLKKRKVKESVVTLCLESLHEAARLSNILGLQSKSSSLLALLADSVCSEEPNGKILSTHALSLDVLISGGLELGSKAPECWDHILMACQYVLRLEHSLFGQQCNATTLLITGQSTKSRTISSIHSGSLVSERLNTSFNSSSNREDENCIDVYNFLQIDNPTLHQDTSVNSIIQKCQQEANRTNSVGVLQGTDAAKVCCALLQSVETLFNDIANKLTMPALCAFLERLFKYCYKQLFTVCAVGADGTHAMVTSARWWNGSSYAAERNMADAAVRLWWRGSEAVLRALRSARPLAHRMAIWGVAGPHFMQVACHKDRRISSKAIQCIHDSVTVLLNEQVELPHFHFNEALLKPFENLLCLELCDNDVQEQIISCICEFVEANRTEIRSGWRPLFGTLRAANNSNQHAAILDVFKVFLTTDNTLVFANAALDCIMCLLSHIKGRSTDTYLLDSESSSIKPPEATPNGYSFNLAQKFKKREKYIIETAQDENSNIVDIDMRLESLKYLESCSQILTIMYSMPRCPAFNTSHRNNTDMPVTVVDPIIPCASLELTKFSDDPVENEESVISYKILSTSLPSTQTANFCLSKLDRPSGVLKVWYSLIEGLVSATIVCPKKYQSKTLEVLYKILHNVMSVPGPAFGLHCTNHLLLPMVQNWLRQIFKTNSGWDVFTPNFKQCCGMTTDLVVDYLHFLQGDISDHKQNEETKKWHGDNLTLPKENSKDYPPVENKAMTFALKQTLLILVECIAQPNESVARLGASCIRHIILTSGHILTNHQWKIVCTSLHRACNVSLTPLKQLTLAFKPNSDSFFGDLALVKVAARRDCTVNDNIRFHSMAQQVFLFDYLKDLSAKPKENAFYNARNICNDPALTDDRSYIFLLYPQDVVSTLNPDLYTVRVPHKSLVVGLLAHQILLQIIATILLQSSSNIIPNVDDILIENCKSSGYVSNQKYSLSSINQDLLLKCLDMSYKRAINFDLRPGLKFLVQKVSNLDCAANLYKQTTSAWIIKMMSLLELFLTGTSSYNLNASDVLYIMKSCSVSEINDINEYDQFIKNILDLKKSWELLCKIYIEAMLLKTHASCFSQQPINNREENVENLPLSSDINKDHEESNENAVHNIKPFTFADFRGNSVESEAGSSIYGDESVNDNKSHRIFYSSNENLNGPNVEESHQDNELNDYKPEHIEDDHDTHLNSIQFSVNSVGLENASNFALKTNPFNQNVSEPILPPQPVPPEIEQQRIQSITKDAEIRRQSLANVLTAFLELVLSFHAEQFELVDLIIEEGLTALSKSMTDPNLLQRIEIYFNRKDTV